MILRNLSISALPIMGNGNVDVAHNNTFLSLAMSFVIYYI